MSDLVVYHGTSAASAEGIRERGLRVSRRLYCRRACACVTTHFPTATRFAVRRTPISDFHAGRTTGVVLEFVLLDDGSHVAYAPVRDPQTLDDEHELAVYHTRYLKLCAIWHFYGGAWHRRAYSRRTTEDDSEDVVRSHRWWLADDRRRSGNGGCPLERGKYQGQYAGPWQDNAIRDLEDEPSRPSGR